MSVSNFISIVLVTVLTTLTTVVGLTAKADGTLFKAPKTLSIIPLKGLSDATLNFNLNLKVYIPDLDQLGVLDNFLEGLAKTGYASEKHLGKGKYSTLLLENNSVEKWTLKSEIIAENNEKMAKISGQTLSENEVNQFNVYLLSPIEGSDPIGDWIIDITYKDRLTNNEIGHFYAKSSSPLNSSKYENKKNIVLHIDENRSEEDGGKVEIHAEFSLNQNEGGGRGTLTYPDWDRCKSWPCHPPTTTTYFSFNSDHLIYQTGKETAKCHDMNSFTDIYADYGLYTMDQEDEDENEGGGESEHEQNIDKIKRFKIFMEYLDSDNKSHSQYIPSAYIQKQGRPQLFSSLSSSSLKNRQDTILTDSEKVIVRKNGEKHEYDIENYPGYLVKKELIEVDANDVGGEIFTADVSNAYALKYSNGDWRLCIAEGSRPEKRCQRLGALYNIAQLANHGENAFIFYTSSDQKRQNKSAKILKDGRILIEGGEKTPIHPQSGDQIWSYFSEQVYLGYNERMSEWRRYYSISDDPWNPRFKEHDKGIAYPLFSPSESSSVNIRLIGNGVNYLLTGSYPRYSLRKEVEMVIRPQTNLNSRLGGVLFTDETDTTPDNGYTWDSKNLVLLNSDGEEVHSSLWNLRDSDATLFSWIYNGEDESDGKRFVDNDGVSYLKDSISGNYLFLDEPIFFSPITITFSNDNNLTTVTLSGLGYDGHLFGIPYYWNIYLSSLSDQNNQDDQNIKRKVMNIPPGTKVQDMNDPGNTYTIRPRLGYRILNAIPTSSCKATLLKSSSSQYNQNKSKLIYPTSPNLLRYLPVLPF